LDKSLNYLSRYQWRRGWDISICSLLPGVFYVLFKQSGFSWFAWDAVPLSAGRRRYTNYLPHSSSSVRHASVNQCAQSPTSYYRTWSIWALMLLWWPLATTGLQAAACTANRFWNCTVRPVLSYASHSGLYNPYHRTVTDLPVALLWDI